MTDDYKFPLALPSAEKHHMTLDRDGPLFILRLHYKDNRFTTEFCQAILTALQIVENIFLDATPVDMALVTIGEGKIYSNGLDLSQVLGYPPFMDVYLQMLKRLLTFCIPTVAALNGHAFAGGCLLAMVHDYRVMRSDRGFICMNEVDLPASLPPGMCAVIREKLTPTTFRNMVLQGHRFSSQEALDQNIVDIICPEKEVFSKAKELALKWAPKAQSGLVYKQLKDEMYSNVVKGLSVPYHRLAPKM
ncbi:hypothetical protein DFQ28_003707 [Apophysomyces sp. BC1034]|nr:hypothetical protein DFQ30_003729 [Apophysomyces sp. BC1015]KAG0178907.1 hypothetical protein DFQ29_002862 [Apophysomyces sp. BC1021]KAG0189214.1 hypothetical protein DFQ28_003707 [Apophysomyces sp. BC1034]